MASALLEFVQGPNSAPAGQAVAGTLTDGAVTVTNGDDTGIVSWLFEIVYVPPGSALGLPTQGPGAVTSFMFTPDVAGSYRLRLTTTDGSGDSDVDIRNFCVPFPNGLIAPPYQRNPTPLALTGAAGKPDEMNISGQPFGWDGDDDTSRKLLFQALQILDGLITGGTGEANTASNVGGGDGWFKQKTGVDLEFKSVLPGAGISISADVDEIILTNSGVRGVANVGAGAGIFKVLTGANIAELKSLVAGTNITLTPGVDDITIDAAGGAGEANTASSAGGTESLVLAKVGVDLPFKGLTAGAGIVLTPSGTDITIAATGGVAEIQVGLDSLASAVPVGGTPTTVAMGFSAVTFDTAVYTFTPNDTDVVVDVSGRYQIILDGSVESTAAGDSTVLVEIFNTGSPIANAQSTVSVDNATVANNGFMVNRIIDLSASDVVGPRFTQTSGSGSVSVSPGAMRFSLVQFVASIAGAVSRKAEFPLVVTAPHAIDTDSGTPFKIEGAGSVRELVAVAQLDTDVAGGSFTFDVQHGPDAGPFVSIGSVTITQGNRSGSFTPGAPVAYTAEDIFVIDRTAIGAFPGGTAEDKQRISIVLRVDVD